MSTVGLEEQITTILRAMNTAGGYPMSLVCTAHGLLVASVGEQLRSEVLAGLTSLFDDIVVRASRDLGLAAVDELSLSDARVGQLVVRPLTPDRPTRLFLVVQVPPHRAWRRSTKAAARRLVASLQPLLATTNTPTDE